MTRLEALREAYAADEIDVNTFEWFVGEILAEREIVLPDIVEWRPRQERVRYVTARHLDAALKEQWTESRL